MPLFVLRQQGASPLVRLHKPHSSKLWGFLWGFLKSTMPETHWDKRGEPPCRASPSGRARNRGFSSTPTVATRFTSNLHAQTASGPTPAKPPAHQGVSRRNSKTHRETKSKPSPTPWTAKCAIRYKSKARDPLNLS